jgi:hypothetical protein
MQARIAGRVLAFVLLTGATSLSPAARADSFDGAYRGMIVCDKLKEAPDILRAPFDMMVNGTTAIFARPVFNRRGTLVVGTELGTGSIDESGAVTLKSSWSLGKAGYQGAYSGNIKGKTGTLAGTQAWKSPESGEETRNCTVAFAQHGS